MSEGSVSAEKFWVEVRPLITSELKPGNFAPLLASLFNSHKPFRFLALDTEDPEVRGRRFIRFFIQFPERNIMEQASNVAKAMLDAEVIRAEPPLKPYKHYVDLELAKNYALPISNLTAKSDVNLVDRIVAALAGSGAALEVVACGDPKATRGIYSYVYRKTHRSPSFSKALSDQGMGIVAEATVQRYHKDISREAFWSYGRQYKTDSWVKGEIKDSEVKLRKNLFTCNVRIYGDDPERTELVKDALPSAMNMFRVFKTEKKPTEVDERLEKPSRHLFRNLLLCRLWWAAPLALLFALWHFGAFNPVRLMSSPGMLTIDTAALTAAIFLAFPLYFLFRSRHPIVLSTEELAEMVGLPTAIGRLPVALGKIPTARMQLGGDWAAPPEPEEEPVAHRLPTDDDVD